MPPDDSRVDSGSCSSGRASDAISEFEPIALEDEQSGSPVSSTKLYEGATADRSPGDVGREGDATLSVTVDDTAGGEPPNKALEKSHDEQTLVGKLAMLGADDLGLSSHAWEEDPRFGGSSSAAPLDEYTQDMVRDLEKAGEKIASLASNAAADVTKFLKSTTAHTADAKVSLSTIANNFSAWFGSTSSSSSAPTGERKISITAGHSKKAPQDLQSMFSVPDTENILESFNCSLIQECSCTHNSYTVAYKVSCPGVLCVTDVHTCFVGTNEEAVPPFKLPHKSVSKVVKRKPKTGDAVLRLEFNGGKEYICLCGFASAGAMDDALGLIELKMEDI